jgi:hypothetical protein
MKKAKTTLIKKLGYRKPSDEVFNEIKTACIEKWEQNFVSPGYLRWKVARFEELKNEGANIMYVVNTFAGQDKYDIISKLSEQAQDYIAYYHETNSTTSPDEDN